MSSTPPPTSRLRDFLRIPPKSLSLLVLHVLAIAAVLVYPPGWTAILLAIGVYALGMFGVSAGYHRYFSHRSFKTSRVGAFILGWIASSTLQRGILWWAAHHRHHHRHSDQEEDVHSPVHHGLLHAHVGWIISEAAERYDLSRVRDLMNFPELRWLDRYYLLPGIAYPTVVGVTGLLVGGVHGCLWALTWAFLIPIVVLYHGTFTINSLSHTWGRRVYDTTDTSRNNALLALVSMGEGWHNNHHHYQTSCRQGFLWWQFDITFYILTALSWVRLVWDLKAPPARVLAERSRVGLPVPVRVRARDERELEDA